jgi:hypothetical protein
LASADFGWQHGLGFTLQPVEGKIAPTKLGPALPGVERLADDKNPNLTLWAATQIGMHNDLVKNGHRAFSAQSRCWPGGTPGQLAFLQPFYFIQTPNVVWIIWERDHQVRRVYLNREHSQNPKPSWFGESVGHYENGELVIDTIGFIEHALSFVDNNTTPHTKDLHVVERWKLTDAGTGNVGCAIALAAVARGSAREIVLVNRTRKTAEAVATDIRYGTPLSPKVDIRDGDYDALIGAGVVLITSGVNEKTGGATDRNDPQGRLRLLDKNAAIYRDIVPQIVRAAPKAVLVAVTDPPDPLADIARASRSSTATQG